MSEHSNYAIIATGRAGEAKAAEILVEARNRILAQQVYIQTSLGLRIVDFVTFNERGQMTGYEVKSGLTAQRSPTQIAKDNLIQNSGGTIVSRGLGGVGLPYGKHVQFPTGMIYILDMVTW